jgi:hypothetical protein
MEQHKEELPVVSLQDFQQKMENLRRSSEKKQKQELEQEEAAERQA